MTDETIEHDFARARISFGPFDLTPAERLLTRSGRPVELGGRSFDLLVALVADAGKVLSKRELLKRVWPDVVVEDGSLRFHMVSLRRALGDGKDGARYIATQIGVGYAFVAPIEIFGGMPEASEALYSPQQSSVQSSTPSVRLPPRVPELIGRGEDLRLLIERVAECPVFTIAGPGGVGKTALAIELGYELATRFDDRVAFVDFGMLENPAVVPSMIAGAMGLVEPTEDPLSLIIGHIANQKFLLVLDNCEHVIDAAADIVERIVQQTPNVHILVTSREPLRVREEQVHRLQALDYPEDPSELSRAELLVFPAVKLFYERARAADSHLEVDDGAARLIGEMCRRLDGVPLAIELVAVRVGIHGIAATARQLGERFSLGWPGRRTASLRHQTLEAALTWSYDLLSPSERFIFERLAIFVGPFSLDAALEVAGDATVGRDDVAIAVDGLVSKSLVSPNWVFGTDGYRLLEMTRSYSRAKLTARGADLYTAAARRHACFFLDELEGATERDPDALFDLATLRPQLGNIRSALDWCFSTSGDVAIGVRLAAASAPVFLNMSHVVECRTWCMRALSNLKENERGSVLEEKLRATLASAEELVAVQ
jgi:predicted ATPase/DNA-binding winged helix-turn-helix (wHTH) protein